MVSLVLTYESEFCVASFGVRVIVWLFGSDAESISTDDVASSVL
jgi:hypothetical protein